MLEAVLLAAVLSVAQLEDDALAPEPPAAEAAEAAPPEPEDTGRVSLLDYQVAQVTRAEVANGRTVVSVENNAPAPRTGSFPARVFVDNSGGPTQTLTLSIQGMVAGATHLIRREVEVKSGERRTVNIPVPSEMRYGTVKALGPGIQENTGGAMYFQTTYEPQKVVLTLSQPEQFERFVGKPPRYSGANVLVHPIPPSDAPSELAAYLGYDLVVVPTSSLLEGLDEAQRSALEAYAATGGHLLLGGALRNTAMFPLQPKLRAGHNDYGFGSVQLFDGSLKAQGLFRATFPVSPHGPLPDYERRYNRASPHDVLLAQATAPLGRFLFIIGLFTLAIGPGSVWVARRRGPAALLVTIPGTALVTCVLIIGYSLIADGFTVHTASYGFSLLDSRGHRLVTQGVTAYYANLAPPRARFDPSTMVVAPWLDGREKYIADLAWKDGLTLGGDFVPSRTYREWGFTSIEPTRARVVVKRKGNGWVAQNALGVKVDRLVVNVDGKQFTGGAVRDGGEVELLAGNTMTYANDAALSRFSSVVIDAVARRELVHHEFLARIEGESLVPTGGINASLNAAQHWVRGEYEE